MAIMTTKFVDAAELMAKVLGMPDYKFATIDHPVSSASDTELEERACTVLDEIRDLILVGSRKPDPQGS